MLGVLVAAAETEESGGLEIILPAAAELVYGAIAFVIVYAVLSRFAFPRINQALEDRREAIQGRMEEAEEALREAEETKARYQAMIDDGKSKANEIIEDAKETAESLRRDIVNRAEAEAQAIVQRAQNEVAAERDRALQELRAEVGTLSVQLASRIVEKELDRSTHQELVDTYIQRLSSTS